MVSIRSKFIPPTLPRVCKWDKLNEDCSKAVILLWIICAISVLFLLCFHARLFINVLWSPAGKELTCWLSFVLSNCEVVTFLLVFWVRYAT